jgi:hypothetical protein
MNLIDELDNLNLETAAKIKVAAIIQALLDQSQKDTAELYAKDLKIQAKLCRRYKRIYSMKPVMRISPPSKRKSNNSIPRHVHPNHLVPAQVASPYRHICHALRCVMSPNPAPVVNVAVI